MATTDDRRDRILSAFQQILTERKNLDSKIATKAEQAEQAQNQQVLAIASAYTLDGIVKGVADLQIEFGGIVRGLSDHLCAEVAKLDQLEQAIKIETRHLQELRQIRIVADAHHLLTQEHQETLRTLDQDAAQQRRTLEQEIAEQRQLWAKEQVAFEQEVKEQQALLTQARQRQEADFQYDLERTRTIAANEYEEQKRQQDKELQTLKLTHERQWADREQILADNQSLMEDYQQQVKQFPTALDAAVQQATTEAVAKVNQDAEVQAKLVEKEWEATKQGYELTIQSLEATIQKQVEQLETLHGQLQDTLRQSHELTVKAFS